MLLRSSFSLVSRQRDEGRMTSSPPQSLAVGCRDSAFSIPPFGLQHSALILAVRTPPPGPHFQSIPVAAAIDSVRCGARNDGCLPGCRIVREATADRAPRNTVPLSGAKVHGPAVERRGGTSVVFWTGRLIRRAA